MPEESRTEFIQFCDKGSFVTPAAQYCWVKNLRFKDFLPLSPFRRIFYRIRLNFRSISYLVILISVGLPCGQLYGFSASINSRMSSSASLNERRLLPLTAALQDMDATFSVIRSGSWVAESSAIVSISSIRSCLQSITVGSSAGSPVTLYSFPPNSSIS